MTAIKAHDLVLYYGEKYMVKSLGKVYATIYSYNKYPHEPFRVKISDLVLDNPEDVEEVEVE